MSFLTKKQKVFLQKEGRKGAEHGKKSLEAHDREFYAAAGRKGAAKRWPKNVSELLS